MTFQQGLVILIGLIGSSVLAGVLAGLLGVGGGIVLVPVLFWILAFVDFPADISMHLAVATSLSTIIFTSLSSARSHHSHGNVDVKILKLWAPGVVIGALGGGLAAKFVDADALKTIFGVIAVLVAINMMRKNILVFRSALPESPATNGVISVLCGLFSALMGIGGGTLAVPILSSFSVPIRKAVGTASAMGILIAVPATLGFIWAGWNVPNRPFGSLGYVNLIGTLIILPFTVGFAPVGASLSNRISTIWVKRCFAIFLGITGCRMLLSVLG
ncbi:sulfite exporter TauE/SafE family protein [Aliiroseovarius sp. PTFE2010]|uniref:sulfite exporter TauE/SafE family protein n=1 Tax=Aliiroseovarius sp. PTFE2010 TaxID=3417190 RepID=UPI003CFBB143